MDILEVNPPEKYRDHLQIKSWSDDIHPHYLLSGIRFDDSKELLTQILNHGGTCLGGDHQADPEIKCDLNCTNCNNSVYRVVELRRRQFANSCKALCEREPRERDEWELSIVRQPIASPKFTTIFWSATKPIAGASVIDTIVDTLHELTSEDFFKNVRLQYIKIHRFDYEKPVDVSAIARDILREAYYG